jgi:hypothetical protein
MTRIARLGPLALWMLLLPLLLAACASGGQGPTAPTPAGLPQGQPTFVYLYTFP